MPEAEAAGRRAVELADQTDFTVARPLAHSYYAETLALAGKREEAAEHGRTALEISSAKGNVMRTAHLRKRLQEVGIDV